MIIDTSGWFCIFDLRDARHKSALSYYARAKLKITHSYVLAEFVALSEARKRHRADMLEFLDNLLSDEEVQIVWVDELLNSKAVDLLSNRPDKSWSLCDAVSFIIMNEAGLTEALTTDKHFEQAGFIKLLES